MTVALPIKKQVSVHWMGNTVKLDVAQDLFSSHQVDRGSKMLLSSLERIDWPDQGTAVDFGCGYGVLGLAWQMAFPDWSMHYVDRDALAVAFAEHNARLAVDDLARRAHFLHAASPPMPPERGFDLVLGNVPGKAGREVVQSLAQTVLDGLASGGVLALVVVHPLAEALREVAGRTDVTCEYDEEGRDHTVLHMRRMGGDVTGCDAFDTGAFDRPAATFQLQGESWRLTPVVGLPEYDSLDYATGMAGELLIEHSAAAVPERWRISEPGAGHLAMLAARLWPQAHGVVTGRDALALRATQRAVESTSADADIEYRGSWGFAAWFGPDDSPFDLIVATVPDQAQQEALTGMIAACEDALRQHGVVVVLGGATEVSRLDRLLRRRPEWRTGRRLKHRGASAMSVFHRE